MSDEKLLESYGLGNLRFMNDRNDMAAVLKQLKGATMMEAGNFLGGTSMKDAALLNAAFQRMIVQQNIIIIRQLDRLTTLLSKRDQSQQ